MAQEKTLNPQELTQWLILGGLVVGGIVLLPSLIDLLSIPGKILELPRDAINTMRKAAQEGKTPPVTNQLTTIPGLSTDTIIKWADKPLQATTSSQAIRKSAHSNAEIIRFPKDGDFIGYFYSAAGEKLGNGWKAWIMLADAPGGSPFGFFPMNNAKIKTSSFGKF